MEKIKKISFIKKLLLLGKLFLYLFFERERTKKKEKKKKS
jgi:hypothetical protein